MTGRRTTMVVATMVLVAASAEVAAAQAPPPPTLGGGRLVKAEPLKGYTPSVNLSPVSYTHLTLPTTPYV